jgi:CBS domain-containing protein
MENIRVEDIMIPLERYPHIPYWFTLRQAVVEMQKSKLEIDGQVSLPRVVLVFDEAYQLLGTTRRRDIMRGLEPPFLVSRQRQIGKRLLEMEVDHNLSEFSFDKLIKGIRDRAELTISDVMQPILATINHDDHLMKAVSEMVEYNLSFLPVLKDNKVVGVVRTIGVFAELSKIIL